MPRKPTGNPRGRPKGTGHLAAPQRLTLWLDGALFAQLEAYAEGRHFHRGTPELAGCVRELLAHALACPYKSQTRNVPHINEQIVNVLAGAENINKQIENITMGFALINKQTENEQSAPAPEPVAVVLPVATETEATPASAVVVPPEVQWRTGRPPQSDAERAKAYRERKKAKKAAMARA